MRPIDAIRPPRKINKNIQAKTLKPKTASAQKSKGISMPKRAVPLLPKTEDNYEQKRGLMWLLVAVTGFIIIMGWLWFWQNGGMKINANRSSHWQQITGKIDEIWKTIKTDVLKIKNITENPNANSGEEKIKNLEEQVFPQFNDPAKQ